MRNYYATGSQAAANKLRLSRGARDELRNCVTIFTRAGMRMECDCVLKSGAAVWRQNRATNRVCCTRETLDCPDYTRVT